MCYGGIFWLPCLSFIACRCAGQISPCHPRDCHDLQCRHLTNTPTPTIVIPDPSGSGYKNRSIRCDFSVDGGRWTVFQRREDGSVNFMQRWHDYKEGFGNNREFWLGNEYIFRLTKGRRMTLRIDMERTNGRTEYAIYNDFSVKSERFNYTLKLGKMTKHMTEAGDMLGFHRDMPFSTNDRDNSPGRCAISFKSGWWYRNCVKAYLNGLWRGNKTGGPLGIDDSRGMMWMPYDPEPRLKACSMKFRPMSASCYMPCPNGGMCDNVGSGLYTCRCTPGYTGRQCETFMPCHRTTCHNGGSQVVDDTICYCKCLKEFRGVFCEKQAHTAGPPATHAPNTSDANHTKIRLPEGHVNVYLIANISAGVLVILLAMGFVWSWKESISADVETDRHIKKEQIEEESADKEETVSLENTLDRSSKLNRSIVEV